VNAVQAQNLIGEYLQARRQLVRPDDVGLPAPPDGRRRVPGLRRAEVALLAGVSTDYYIRLEQGRDLHPSEQVLDALARALQLDDFATGHLHSLASPPPPPRRRRDQRSEKVPPGIVQMIESWAQTPAIVENRYMYVLAANPMAIAVGRFLAVGTNPVRTIFLDPGIRDVHPDWEAMTARAVAHLRAFVGPDVSDPSFCELVGELCVRSERFRQLWARHDTRPTLRGTTRIDHPQVGPLELSYEKLLIPDTDHQALVVYHAEPGSRSAESLALLATLVAADPQRAPERTTTERETGDAPYVAVLP
jgi:transcriptional regulator with XRE-family HTH domain